MGEKLLWQDAEEKAQQVLDAYWDGKYPVNVAAISGAVGLTPYFAELPDGVFGFVAHYPFQIGADSYVEVSEPNVVRRFRFAHELGHYVEGVLLSCRDDFSFIDCRDTDQNNWHECYANEFAESLLMPATDFEMQTDCAGGLVSAAQYFQVSLAAACKRDKHIRNRRRRRK